MQILGSGIIIFIFTIYSLKFCPYRPMLRVCFHLSDLTFIAQMVLCYFVSSTQYGNVYSLDILNSDGVLYRAAWVMLALNYLQIAIYSLLSLIILFDLSKTKFCKNNSIQNIAKNP